MEWRCDSFMTNEKITAMPVKKTQIHLTATLSLPLRLHERAWILAGITRAKKKVYLVGQWNAVCQAIHTDDAGRRNTALGERITRYYYQYLQEREPEQLRLAV